MNDSNKQNDCSTFKTLQDKLHDTKEKLSGEETFFVDKHLTDCDSCRAWKAQISEMLILTASMPQFDVPEALTQQILKAVDQNRKVSPSFEKISWLPLSSVAFIALVIGSPMETWTGLFSWIIGLAGVWGLKLLLNSEDTQELAGNL